MSENDEDDPIYIYFTMTDGGERERKAVVPAEMLDDPPALGAWLIHRWNVAEVPA